MYDNSCSVATMTSARRAAIQYSRIPIQCNLYTASLQTDSDALANTASLTAEIKSVICNCRLILVTLSSFQVNSRHCYRECNLKYMCYGEVRNMYKLPVYVCLLHLYRHYTVQCKQTNNHWITTV